MVIDRGKAVFLTSFSDTLSQEQGEITYKTYMSVPTRGEYTMDTHSSALGMRTRTCQRAAESRAASGRQSIRHPRELRPEGRQHRGC